MVMVMPNKVNFRAFLDIPPKAAHAVYSVNIQQTTRARDHESTRGLAEKCRTHDQNVVSSSPATASVFVSLGKILNLNLLR